jgi:hypothetical protein
MCVAIACSCLACAKQHLSPRACMLDISTRGACATCAVCRSAAEWSTVDLSWCATIWGVCLRRNRGVNAWRCCETDETSCRGAKAVPQSTALGVPSPDAVLGMLRTAEPCSNQNHVLRRGSPRQRCCRPVYDV